LFPVCGKEEREGDSPSYFNIAEVETINKYLSELLDSKVRDKKMKFLQSSQIGIMVSRIVVKRKRLRMLLGK
jgi:hypothetical protein